MTCPVSAYTIDAERWGCTRSWTTELTQDISMEEPTWQSERRSSRLMPPLKLLSSATVPARRRTGMTDAVVSSRIFELCTSRTSRQPCHVQACSSL